MQILEESTLCEDLDDVVMFNQINERLNQNFSNWSQNRIGFILSFFFFFFLCY